MLILFNSKLILVCHNSAVFAYLVASCKINTVIFFIVSNKTFNFHFLHFWVTGCFSLGEGEKDAWGHTEEVLESE